MADGHEALSQKLIEHRDKLRSVLINVCGARARAVLGVVRQVKGCVKKFPFSDVKDRSLPIIGL